MDWFQQPLTHIITHSEYSSLVPPYTDCPRRPSLSKWAYGPSVVGRWGANDCSPSLWRCAWDCRLQEVPGNISLTIGLSSHHSENNKEMSFTGDWLYYKRSEISSLWQTDISLFSLQSSEHGVSFTRSPRTGFFSASEKHRFTIVIKCTFVIPCPRQEKQPIRREVWIEGCSTAIIIPRTRRHWWTIPRKTGDPPILK